MTNRKYFYCIFLENRYPERGSIETKVAWWRHDFEKQNNVKFFKRVCFRPDKEILDSQFGIKATPAFMFFHTGKKVGDIFDLNETKPEYCDATKRGEDTADETKIKQKIIDLCKSHISVKQNPNP